MKRKIKRIIAILTIVNMFCFVCFFGCANTSWMVETESDLYKNDFGEFYTLKEAYSKELLFPQPTSLHPQFVAAKSLISDLLKNLFYSIVYVKGKIWLQNIDFILVNR